MIKKLLHHGLFSLFVFSTQLSFSQGITRNTYYDKEAKVLKETYQVSNKDTTLKQGLYKLYSPDGVLLEKQEFSSGKRNGNVLHRNTKGYIYYTGTYDAEENFTGIEISWKDTVNFSHLNIDYAEKDKAQLLNAERLSFILDTIKRSTDQNEPLKNNAVFKGLYYDVSSKYQKLQMIPRESSEFQESAMELIYSYISLKENYSEYKDDEKIVRRFLVLTDSLFRQRYPALLSDHIVSLAVRAEQFDKPLPKKEDHYTFTRRISTEIRNMIYQMEDMFTLDNQLMECNSFLTRAYTPLEYPVLFKKKIQPLLNEANERESQKDFEKRLGRMIILNDSLQVYKNRFPELNPINQKIDTSWPVLYENIRRKFQDIWVRNTQSINILYNEYLDEESVEKKILMGISLTKAIEELANVFKEVSEINDKIEEYYGIVDTRYSKEQRYIYDAQVQPLQERVAMYRKQEDFNSRKSLGKDLAATISELYLNIDTLTAQEKKISSMYSEIRINYEQNYPGIYNNDIKILAKSIDDYLKISDYTQKLSKGRELITVLFSYQRRYYILESQKKWIADSLILATNLYKKTIQPIYRIDIQGLNIKQKQYLTNDTLDDKISKGFFILKSLKKLILNYDSLKRSEDYMVINYPLLKKNYKKRYKMIYKAAVEPMGNELDAIQDIGYLEERMQRGSRLHQQIRTYTSQLIKLDTLSAKIQSDYRQFELIYENDKANKIILKKGKQLFDYYEEEFSNSDSFDKSLRIANRVSSLLGKLGSYSNKENSFLKEKLKNAKTPQDIEAAVQ